MEEWTKLKEDNNPTLEEIVCNQSLMITNLNRKVDKLLKIIKDLDYKITQRDEREINKQIRSYAVDKESYPFAKSKIPLSQLLNK